MKINQILSLVTFLLFFVEFFKKAFSITVSKNYDKTWRKVLLI